MPRILLLAIVTLALALPATVRAATPDPSRLVLRQADLPAGYEVDRAETGVRTNAREVGNVPRVRTLFAQWGRLTGYYVQYDGPRATVASRADVLRMATGARLMLEWHEQEFRKLGIKAFVRSRISLGDDAWVYVSRTPTRFISVVWRSGRVFASLGTTGLSQERTVALARAQQRHVAAGLR